jgi:sec-independent protein translocase protein TatA
LRGPGHGQEIEQFMIGDIGWQELAIVLVIVVIIFGAGRLPEIGGAVGKSIKEFRTQSRDDAPAPVAASAPLAAPGPPASVSMRADDI